MIRSMKNWLPPPSVAGILLIGVLFIGLPERAAATLTISLGNGSPNTTLQFVDPTGTTGTVFDAEDNTLGTVARVTVDAPGIINGTGQAKIIPNTTMNFMNVVVDPVNYLGWTGIELNLGFSVMASANETFTVYGIDQLTNVYSETFAITNGENPLLRASGLGAVHHSDSL